MGIVINLETVDIGETENWLHIEGYVPRMSNDKMYSFDYCGTELNSTASFSDKDLKRILEKMQVIFGYAPFSERISSIRELICKGVQIII